VEIELDDNGFTANCGMDTKQEQAFITTELIDQLAEDVPDAALRLDIVSKANIFQPGSNTLSIGHLRNLQTSLNLRIFALEIKETS
jgi:hypothetical protein